MIPPYDETYLSSAQRSLARMLDFAVYELHWEIGPFFDLFLSTGLAEEFGAGDPHILAGMSGVELAYLVLEEAGIPEERGEIRFPMNRSEAYWTGWALAWYQWRSGLPFADIVQAVPMETIRDMYHPFHKMDLRQFEDRMNELMQAAAPSS